MAKRTFKIKVIGTATLTIDEQLIGSVDDGWRKQFYAEVKSPKDIAEHIGFNMMVNHCDLTEIDGFADRKDDEVKMLGCEWSVEECYPSGEG